MFVTATVTLKVRFMSSHVAVRVLTARNVSDAKCLSLTFLTAKLSMLVRKTSTILTNLLDTKQFSKNISVNDRVKPAPEYLGRFFNCWTFRSRGVLSRQNVE